MEIDYTHHVTLFTFKSCFMQAGIQLKRLQQPSVYISCAIESGYSHVVLDCKNSNKTLEVVHRAYYQGKKLIFSVKMKRD